ncbi:MAG: C45 family peptidase [Caulobacterales bacterium]|nr:C45 family peptidase [Caulobacterales bacterium]
MTMSSFEPGRTRLVTVRGSNREMGRQLGETCRVGVEEALALVHSEVGRIGPLSAAREKALAYAPVIEAVAPHLTEEITGLAEGAGISEADALLLQLRFEATGFDGRGGDGCSSFAVRGANGEVVTGQNVDTVEEHIRLGLIVHMVPDDGPDILMYTYYPGMIGYLGFNSHGVSVFGNALLSPGWRIGFPRYLSCRLALEQSTAAAAEAKIRGLRRASTINLLLTDASGDIRNLEQTVDEVATLTPQADRFFHTNHYLHPPFEREERLLAILPDSTARYAAGSKAINAIEADGDMVAGAKALLRNHDNYPSGICRHRAEVSTYDGDQWMTIASLIAEPAAGRLHAYFGPPCEGEYAIFNLPACAPLAAAS